MSESEDDGLSPALRRRIETLVLQRDSVTRVLERTERSDLYERYLGSMHRLSEEIDSLVQALEYNAWLDDAVSRGPWVAVAITHVEEHDPMDGVHIEIVYEDPDVDEELVEVPLVDRDPDAP
ncbi:MAG: hypothetical protein AAF721_37740 [Myxococcota bacterium]